MKKTILLGVLILSGCATSNKILTTISKTTDSDIHDTIVINQAAKDGLGINCSVWISDIRPKVKEVLNAKTSGFLSIIAKRRAINILYIGLTPQFERNCGPVVMDERRWWVKLFSPLG